MEPHHEERRLISILSADVVGYSRLMAADESGTFAQLKTHRKELLEPKTAEHHGRTVKLMGDGALIEFGSVVDAVNFAVDVQRAMVERNAMVPEDMRIIYRVGINIGDVIIDGDDIYGDGVNVAARLESLAEPGGICISRTVYDQVKKKVNLAFEDLGEKRVKNIPDPVRMYRVDLSLTDTDSVSRGSYAMSPPLPDKPSIAVLPFDNMSGDPEHEFFADGMAEDIITCLSHYRWFFVIARNSSFTYKGRAIDVKQVAKELGVRYVLEGSVRKAGNRVRVTAQLIDATTGNHIWAEHYDRELDDIFALQDEITETIVASVEPELGTVERERARRKPPGNLDAWGSYQRGLWHFYDDWTRDGVAEAKRLFQRACDLDPGFGAAYAELAYAHIADIHRGFTNDLEVSLEQAAEAAKKSVALDVKDPVGHLAMGRVHVLEHNYDKGIAEMEIALGLNANSERTYYGLGLALLYGGRPEESIPQFEKAIRLSPYSPMLWAYLNNLARAHFRQERYKEALELFEKAIEQPNATFMPLVHAAATLGHLDRIDEARALLAEVKKKNPDFSVDTINGAIGIYGRHSGVEQIIDGLSKAGMG